MEKSRKIGEFARSHGIEDEMLPSSVPEDALYNKVYKKTAEKRENLKSKLVKKPAMGMTHDEKVEAMKQRVQE